MHSPVLAVGPAQWIPLVLGMGVGAWAAVKLSQRILKVYYFAIFTVVGGLIVLGLSLAKTGQLPQTGVWIAGALAFGVMASAIRAKMVRILSLAALVGAIYLVVRGHPLLPEGTGQLHSQESSGGANH